MTLIFLYLYLHYLLISIVIVKQVVLTTHTLTILWFLIFFESYFYIYLFHTIYSDIMIIKINQV